MIIQSHHITVSKQAKYATLGNLGPKTKYFWFVLHGSHMICEQMLYKFSDFDPDTHFIVAPEGLSRQYAKSYSGDVVATWMTSRDRLLEIEDFSNYLTKLYRQFENQLPVSCIKIALGFSQGGTTLFRWLHHSKVPFNNLIAYSCSIPEDIDLKSSKSNLQQIPILYTYGSDDQYFNDETIKVLDQIINNNNLDVNILPYKGKHKVDKIQLKYIFENHISDIKML